MAQRLTDVGRIVCGTKDELGGTVIPGANVADIWLSGNEDFSTTKVAKFEDTGLRVQKQVLRLDVAMANADRMNVCERAKKLIHV